MKSEALLVGRIFDDRGNRMSRAMPASVASSTATICHPPCSRASLNGPDRYSRVPAVEIEALVIRSVREHLKLSADRLTTRSSSTPTLRASRSNRINWSSSLPKPKQQIAPNDAKPATSSTSRGTKRHQRDAVRFSCPRPMPPQDARPIRSETRATLVASIARGRRWLDELIDRPDRKCGKHRDARGLQRSQGQHDDLACIPRARSRQGCDRRTAASRHGSCPPLRSACRMVTPAPDARTSAQ